MSNQKPLFPRMESIVNDLVKSYHSDFEIHDKAKLRKNPNRSFFWQVRSTGTWLWLFPENIEQLRNDLNFSTIEKIADGKEAWPISFLAMKEWKRHYGSSARLYFYDRNTDNFAYLLNDMFNEKQMDKHLQRLCEQYLESFNNKGKTELEEYLLDLRSWASSKGIKISDKEFNHSRKAKMDWLGGIVVYYNQDETEIFYKIPEYLSLKRAV